MPWYDLPAEQLKDYRTGTAEPADLDQWWRLRLDEARAAAREPATSSAPSRWPRWRRTPR
jgi:cephalosporin-C deacetylase